MTTTDCYLPRQDQTRLRDKLNLLPSLVEDLAITETRQARILRPGLGKLKHQKPGSSWPFHLEAASAATELDRCLAGWVKFVCVHKQIRYTSSRSVLSHGNWLKRNIPVLAGINGSQDAYPDITGRIIAVQVVIDLPPDDDLHMDPQRVARANRQVVTAGQIEKIASKLGARGRALTTERIRVLTRNGHVWPIRVDPDTGTKFYRLGDVLEAHAACSQRSRATRGATHGA